MATMRLDDKLVEAAVLGGCILGGGGGGSMEEGRKVARLAVSLSSVDLIDLEDMDESSMLINVSSVGAPSAKDAYVEPIYYVRALELISKVGNVKIHGITTNEAGGLATVNGWLQASMLGVPVVDAPSNGRAHPTGIMGSMGLHKVQDYLSIQAAIGGSKEKSSFLELVTQGSIENTSAVVRNAAVQARGLVAVARNPVTVRYAKEHAALGAVKQAIGLGEEVLKCIDKGLNSVIDSVCNYLEGEVVTSGCVKEIDLESRGGFDVGRILLDDGFEVTFWNEYMTLEKDGQRIATFPDLIAVFDIQTVLPITSAEVQKGQNVTIIKVPKENLRLGAGMKDPDLFKVCEDAVNKKIIEFIF